MIGKHATVYGRGLTHPRLSSNAIVWRDGLKPFFWRAHVAKSGCNSHFFAPFQEKRNPDLALEAGAFVEA